MGNDAPVIHRAQDSKLLWALGNYSRFVRPGAVRYEVTGEEDPYGLMVTAYQNTDKRWVVVVINYSNEQQTFSLKMSDGKQYRWKAYRTSDEEGENLKPVDENDGRMKLSARSVTTFVEK
jgi:O-glycosyl hydrolase